jgi:dienelactone hydrolase
MTPCSDGEFSVIRAQFDYDRTPLNAMVEPTEERSPFWRRKERISFDAAYGGERVTAYLFLPTSGKPPYQAVLYWPGSGAVGKQRFQELPERHYTELILASGRALFFPVYKGTFERSFATQPAPATTPLAFQDWTIQACKDLRRSMDFLKTRQDIDPDHIAYLGASAGASFGPMVLAVEERFQAAILIVGGFPLMEPPSPIPAVEPINHAPRVRTPTLMINGETDVMCPVETSQRPLFEWLGTSKADKRHKLYPGGHGIIGLYRSEIRADVRNWLDRYLGPVE